MFFLLVITLLKFSDSAFAQFNPQICATYEFGIGNINKSGFGVDAVAGYSLGSIWRLGIGCGLHENSVSLQSSTGSRERFDYVVDFVPLYLDGKLNLMTTRIRPYANIQLGFDIMTSDRTEFQQGESCAYPAFTFGIGVDFQLKRGRFFLQFSFRNRDWDFEEYCPGSQMTAGYCWQKK